MSMRSDYNKVMRLLSGTLSDSEIERFKHLGHENSNFRKLLESESSFEAQFSSDPWLENEMGTFYIDNQDFREKPNVVPFVKYNIYKIAALIIICLLGLYTSSFFLHFPSYYKTNNFVSHKQITLKNNEESSSDTVITLNPSVNNIAYLQSPSLHKKNAVVYIEKETIIKADSNSQMSIVPQTDSIVIVELDDGQVTFSIEKNRFTKFIVRTPLLDITVTGTVFTVSVDSLLSSVNVNEGSVRIRHRISGDEETILSGESIIADSLLLEKSLLEHVDSIVTNRKFIKDFAAQPFHYK